MWNSNIKFTLKYQTTSLDSLSFIVVFSETRLNTGCPLERPYGGEAISGAPNIKGTNQFPNPPLK